MKRYLPFLIPAFVFLFIKVSSSGIRLSDTNIYFYTGYQIIQGKILYKDIFFTNFPFLPYLSAVYFFILRGDLTAFFFTAVIETLAVGFVIYLIVLKKTKDILQSTLSAALYLFSFIILSTSDHQSGVFAASLFVVLSYFFYLKKRFLLTGVFLALALMTKAYFLPIFFAFIVFLFLKSFKKNRNSILYFGGGFFTTILVILLPSLLLARGDFFKDVFLYSLTRSQGLSKSEIFWFFITHDIILFVLLIFNLLAIRRRMLFGLISLFGIAFVILYKDIYFLYLNFFIPFLCLSFPFFNNFLQSKFQMQKYIIPSIISLFLLYNLISYFSGFQNIQKLPQFLDIVDTIKKENPKFLYGVNDLTPSLAYYTSTPLLGDVTDTNANIFRKGYLDAKRLSSDAIKSRTMLVTHGINYPEFGVRQDIIDEIFDVKILEKCELKYSYPVRSEGYTNRINLFTCY